MSDHSERGQLPDAVLFDMDGTLFDSEKLWDISLAELADRLGGMLSAQERAALVGSNLVDTISMMHEAFGVDADAEESGRWLLARTKQLFAAGMVLKPGAVELVAAVRAAGVPAAIVTSTARDLTDVALRNFPAGSFQASVCGDEVTRTKPDPESYLLAADRLGVSTVGAVAIEDSPRGIDSAERAGCAVVAVPSEVPVPPGPYRVVVDSLVGVTVEWLGTLPARLGTAGRAAGASNVS